MAVFLGVFLALLTGAIGGYLSSAIVFMSSKPLRDFWNDLADETDSEW